jgi:hypothetical protein
LVTSGDEVTIIGLEGETAAEKLAKKKAEDHEFYTNGFYYELPRLPSEAKKKTPMEELFD